MERTVTVWGKPVQISIHQKSKTVWIAIGFYMGERIETKGRSANSAMALWRDAATYKGN